MEFLQREAPIKIALYFDRSESFLIQIFKGVTRFLSENEDVGLVAGSNNEDWMILDKFDMIEESGADGLLCFSHEAEEAKKLQALSIPYINLSGTEREYSADPLLYFDDEKMGYVAGEYLRSLGFQNFAFCARSDDSFIKLRLKGLSEYLVLGGYHVHEAIFKHEEYYQDKYASWDLFREDVLKWLPTLPRPISIVVPVDHDARLIYTAAKELGYHIPNDIALIGIGNILSACYTVLPTLSSVPHNVSQAGFYGMSYLKMMILGKGDELKPMPIGPLPVEARDSTNIEHFEDELVFCALQFIRKNAHKGIGYEDVLKAVHSSRTTLNRRFKAVIGTGVVESIRRIQLMHAQELLLNKKFLVDEVAWHCGFSDTRQFQRAFRKFFNMSASEYRRKIALGPKE